MNCPNCKYFASCSGKYECHYEKRSEVKEMIKEIDKVIEEYYTDNPDWERVKIGGSMEEIIKQIIDNRNYHILSDEQVEAIKKLEEENKELQLIKTMIQALETNDVSEETYYLIGKRGFLRSSYKQLLDDYIPKSVIEEIIYPTPENPIEIEVQNSEMYKKLQELLEKGNK